MVNTKKIITSLVIISMLFSQVNLVSANDDSLYQDYYPEISYELTQEIDLFLNNYYKKLDNLSLSDKVTTLKKLKIKIDLTTNKEKKKSKKEVLKYISSKINNEISSYEAQKKFSASNLTNDEIKKVEENLVSLQMLFFNQLDKNINTFKKDYLKMTNYNEIWNSQTSFKLKKEWMWEMNLNLWLKNYEINQNIFDQSIKSWVNLEWNYSLITWTWNINLDTIAEFISKDWEFYLALNNLKYDSKNKEILANLDKYLNEFKSNKFVKFYSDEESKKVYEYMKKISLNEVMNSTKTTLNKSIFTPYKKEWNKYYLIPSKDFCKEVISQSNSFLTKTLAIDSNNECTNYAYWKMLKDFTNNWEMYIELWTNNNLVYNYKYDNSNINLNLNYNKDLLNSLKLVWIENKVEVINIDYLNNNKLDIVLLFDKNNKFDFKSTIENSNFKSILSNLNLDNSFVKLNWKFELKDSKFAWKYLWTTKDNNKWKVDLSLNWDKENLNWKVLINTKDFNLVWDLNKLKNIWKVNIKFDADLMWEWKLANVFTYSWDYKIEDKYFELKSKYDSTLMMVKYNGDLNLTVDQKNSKNDWYLLFTINEWKNNLLELKSENKAIRNNPSKEIKAPTEFIEYSVIEDEKKISRDKVRENDLKAIMTALNQSYSEMWEFPSEKDFFTQLEKFMSFVPVDDKEAEIIEWCDFWYNYWVWIDEKTKKNKYFVLSACMESKEYKQKSIDDKWLDKNRYEIWVWIDKVSEVKFIEDIYSQYEDETEY